MQRADKYCTQTLLRRLASTVAEAELSLGDVLAGLGGDDQTTTTA